MTAGQLATENDVLVQVKDLKKHFPVTGGFWSRPVSFVKAVDGLTFDIKRGETLGLVGESGCGKTTAGRLILRLLPKTAGEVYFEGQDVFAASRADLIALRREMQIIFQDPYASLDPRKTVGDIVGEPFVIHKTMSGRARQERIQELLEVVGLSAFHAPRYPHEFSGGQRQRVGIARALALNPKLIICDEPVSALDVSIQSQVINLLEELQEQYGLTYLFISHNLSVVKHISDRIGVMYLGKIVELAECQAMFDYPLHPYTRALLSAMPIPNPKRIRQRVILKGDVPSPMNPPPGCAFHTRCPQAMPVCRQQAPVLTDVGPGHEVACHLVASGQK